MDKLGFRLTAGAGLRGLWGYGLGAVAGRYRVDVCGHLEVPGGDLVVGVVGGVHAAEWLTE
jgi:hypothetical protein